MSSEAHRNPAPLVAVFLRRNGIREGPERGARLEQERGTGCLSAVSLDAVARVSDDSSCGAAVESISK